MIDRAPDIDVPVDAGDGVLHHSLREIGATKICALLGRAEIRDLIDLRAILAKGARLETLLQDAERKDGGVAAATLAWLLDGLAIGADAKLPADVPPAELDSFRRTLVKDLRRLAAPPQ